MVQIWSVFYGPLLVGCTLLLSTPHSYAELEWDAKEISLSVKSSGGGVPFLFKFRNGGDSVVTLKEARTTCSCTVPKFEKLTYAPGEKGELAGVYALGGRHGLNTANIYVDGEYMRDGNKVLIRDALKLEVSVEEQVKIKPGISLWRVGAELTTKTITINVVEGGAFTIALAPREESTSAFDLNLKELTTAKAYELSVRPKSTQGIAQERVAIFATNQDGVKLHFFVHLIVR